MGYARKTKTILKYDTKTLTSQYRCEKAAVGVLPALSRDAGADGGAHEAGVLFRTPQPERLSGDGDHRAGGEGMRFDCVGGYPREAGGTREGRRGGISDGVGEQRSHLIFSIFCLDNGGHFNEQC